jgi:uncharacterized metal-binding protein
MVDLPKKKVGIVACSGEELAEGTVTRLAALQVLEKLRPQETVTICLPLFLAGGEGDRAFARFYPTIAVDGCALRCAARATEMYSGKPAASVVVTELAEETGLPRAQGLRRLDQAGHQSIGLTAQRIANIVNDLLDKKWSRSAGEFIVAEEIPLAGTQPDKRAVEAACSCGSGIPVSKLIIEGQSVSLIALPIIFQQFYEQGKLLGNGTARELLDTVKIYNPIPPGSEAVYAEALLREYSVFCTNPEAVK